VNKILTALILWAIILSARSFAMGLSLESPHFSTHGTIPTVFTCEGPNEIPNLIWHDPPTGTQSFVLIVDDPDAPMGTWDHWLVFNIPAEVHEIKGNLPPKDAIVGKNSWGNNKYEGPCPPSGTHRYFFSLYALDSTLKLTEDASKSEVLNALKPHMLQKAELIGTYEKIK
jgi:Raf kinase inhibitor-like YbhB/YbcL family protein